MGWSLRRKLLYALSVAVTLSAITVFVMREKLFPPPTCFDNKKNGYELDVDCGGMCSLRCRQEVNPPVVVWSKAVQSSKDLYDVVVMVNNTNVNNASRLLGYTIMMYNDAGKTIATFSGSTTAPLAGKFPIIIQNIVLTEIPKTVIATLTDGPHYSVQESPTSPTVKIVDRMYEQDSISRVYATVINTKHVEINNLNVRLVLFDDDDNAYAVGQTVVPRLEKEGFEKIVFTWKEVLPHKPTRIEVYPIFDPFRAVNY